MSFYLRIKTAEWGAWSLLLATLCEPCGYHVWLMALVCSTPSLPLCLSVSSCPSSFPLFPNHTLPRLPAALPLSALLLFLSCSLTLISHLILFLLYFSLSLSFALSLSPPSAFSVTSFLSLSCLLVPWHTNGVNTLFASVESHLWSVAVSCCIAATDINKSLLFNNSKTHLRLCALSRAADNDTFHCVSWIID